MAFTVTLNGNTYTEASFDEYAYANENTGLPAALQDVVKHTRDALKSPSSTSINLSTLVVDAALSITVAVDKYFELNQTILIYSSQVETDFVYGIVTSYTASTGALNLTIKEVGGTSTHSNWIVVLGLGKFSQQVEDDAAAAAASALASSNSETAAGLSEVAAGNSQDYAEDWAITPEDTPVSVAAGGDGSTTFSSKHWAAKSAADGHSHTNKIILDNTTASFLTADETKLDGLPAVGDVVQKGTNNVITAQHTISGVAPSFFMEESDQGVDLKKTAIQVNVGTLKVDTYTDAGAFIKSLLQATRDGNVTVGGDLSLQGASGNEGSQIDFAASPNSTLSGYAIDVSGTSPSAANFRVLQRDASDVTTVLNLPAVNGTVLSTGNDGELVRTDTARTITVAHTLSATAPGFYMKETDQGTDLKDLYVVLDGGTLQVQARNEVGAYLSTPFGVTRAGNGTFAGTVSGSNLSGTNTGDEVIASEGTAGVVEQLTQTETDTGADTSRYPTIAKLRGGFAVSKAANGYIRLPTWLGGVTLQWGKTGTITFDTTSTITFPLAFSTACRSVQTTLQHTATSDFTTRVSSVTTSSFALTSSGVTAAHYWVAIGY